MSVEFDQPSIHCVLWLNELAMASPRTSSASSYARRRKRGIDRSTSSRGFNVVKCKTHTPTCMMSPAKGDVRTVAPIFRGKQMSSDRYRRKLSSLLVIWNLGWANGILLAYDPGASIGAVFVTCRTIRSIGEFRKADLLEISKGRREGQTPRDPGRQRISKHPERIGARSTFA